MTRPPYKPGEKALVLRNMPDVGTCLVPVVVVAVDEGWDGEGCVTYHHTDAHPFDTRRLHGQAIHDYMTPITERTA